MPKKSNRTVNPQRPEPATKAVRMLEQELHDQWRKWRTSERTRWNRESTELNITAFRAQYGATEPTKGKTND